MEIVNPNNLNWGELPFGYLRTSVNVRCHFKDGKWGEIEISDSEYIQMHIAATCLHYGQEAFEGLKAYRGVDGEIRLFRWRENAKRIISSAKGIAMAEPPEELFGEMLRKVVSLNREFIPPHESGATLYIRPLLIGTSPEVGVKPSNEYTLLMFVTPVGPYFKEGFKPVSIFIEYDTDRAAPLGTGNLKVGGNYAASLTGLKKAHEMGYSTAMYLDAKEKRFIDEIGAANFFAIKDNTYITPRSRSILPSITNMSIETLAEHLGLKIDIRAVEVTELDSFKEVGACGTAAIISPIGKIFDPKTNKVYTYTEKEAGEVSTKLYNLLRDIQSGKEKDHFDWIEILK